MGEAVSTITIMAQKMRFLVTVLLPLLILFGSPEYSFSAAAANGKICKLKFGVERQLHEVWEERGIRWRCLDNGRAEHLGCPLSSTQTTKALGKTWEAEEMVHQCKQHAASIKGCVPVTNNLLFIGVSYKYQDGEILKKCTANGVVLLECIPGGGGVKRQKDKSWSATKFNEDGTPIEEEPCDGKLAPKGCKHNGAIIPMNHQFNETGMTKVCTEDGVVEIVGCPSRNHGMVTPNAVYVTKSGKRKQCTEGGLKIIGCTYNRLLKKVGDRFPTKDKKLMECQANGLPVHVGCALGKGKIALFGEKIDIDGNTQQCTADRGFVLAAPNTESAGKKTEQPTKQQISEGKRRPSGQPYRDGDLEKVVDDQGTVHVIGCYSGSKRYNPGEATQGNEGTVSNCTTDGIKLVHCKGSDGKPVAPGEIYLINNAWKKCGDNDPDSVKYHSQSGYHLPMEPFQEGNLEKVFDEKGKLHITGCYWNEKRYNPGDKFTDQGVQYECTSERGLEGKGCLDSNGKLLKFGLPFNNGSHWKVCTNENDQELFFESETGKHRPQEPFEEAGFEKVFDEAGTLHVTGCYWKSERYNFGDKVSDGSVWRQCDANHGMKAIGCKTGEKRVDFGKVFVDKNVWTKCTEKGLEEVQYASESGMHRPGEPFQEGGMEKIFDEHGTLRVIGCSWKGKSYPMGEQVTDGQMVRQCGTNGMKAVHCKGSNGAAVPFKATVNDANVWKKCTKSGLDVLQFASESGLQRPGTPFKEGELEKVFDETGVLHVIGCFVNGQRYAIGEQITKNSNNNNDGFVRKCTKDGTVKGACRTADGEEIPIGQTSESKKKPELVIACSEESGAKVAGCKVPGTGSMVDVGKTFLNGKVWKKCTESGSTDLEFRTEDGGMHKPGVPFTDGGLEKVFDENGKLRITGCVYENKRYNVGQEVHATDKFQRSCTESGVVKKACKTSSGEVIQFGKTAPSKRRAGVALKCSEDHGVQIAGCQSSDGMIVELGEQFKDAKGVLRTCTENGVDEVTFQSDKGGKQRPNVPFEEGGFEKVFDKNGTLKITGCYWRGQRYGMGEEASDSGLLYKCDKNKGMALIGCKAANGDTVQFGQSFQDDKHIWRKCTEEGAVELQFPDKAGKLHRPGKPFEEDSFKKVFEETGKLATTGCYFAGQQYAFDEEIHGDKNNKENSFISKCTKDGIVKVACTPQDGEGRIAIGGKKLDNKRHSVVLQCTENGIQMHGCEEPNGKLVNFGEPFLEGKIWKKCEKTGAVDLKYPDSMGKLHSPGEPFQEGEFEKVFNEHGKLRSTGCFIAGKRYDFGQKFDDRNVFSQCTENGANVVGCITTDGQRVYIDQESISANSIVSKCFNAGMKPVGCKPKTSSGAKLVEFGHKFQDGSSLFTCTESGLKQVQCKSSAGLQTIGVPFAEDNFIKVCGNDGKVKVIGCGTNINKYGKLGEKIMRDSAIVECTENGVTAVGCVYKTNTLALLQTFVYEKTSLIIQCTSKGKLVPTGCSFAGRNLSFDQTVDQAKFRYQCSKNGIAKIGCLTEKGAFVPTNVEWTDDTGLTVSCSSDSGLRTAGCKGPQGTVKMGMIFRDSDDTEKNCTENGAVSIDTQTCATGRIGKVARVGDVFDLRGVPMKCTRAGAIVWGCKLKGSTNYEKVGKEFDGPNLLRYRCAEGGVLMILGCYRELKSTEPLLKLNETTVRRGIQYRCTEEGLKDEGCKDGEALRNFGGEFFVGDIKKLCTSRNGIVDMGCRDESSGHRPFGNTVKRKVRDQEYVLKCTQEQGYVQIGCIYHETIITKELKLGEKISSRSREVFECTKFGVVTPEQAAQLEKTAAKGDQISNEGTFKRTAILIRRETAPGQLLFIKGGVSQKDCNGDACSIPIKHVTKFNVETKSYDALKAGDKMLDWNGQETGQGSHNGIAAAGTPLYWTTNDRNDRKHFHPLNKFGAHFWLVDVSMDCSKAKDGLWFEFKAVVNNQSEDDIKQGKCSGSAGDQTPPYNSTQNHVGKCGFINAYEFNASRCRISVFP